MNQQYSKFTGQMGNPCQFPHTLHLRLNHAGFFLLLFQFRFQNIDSRFCVFYIFQKSLVHFRKLDGINQTRHLIQIQFLHSLAPPVHFAFQPFQLVTLCMLSLLDWVILFWKGNFFRVKIICHIRPDTFQHSILQCVHICTGLVATHFRCALVHPAANIASLSPIRLWLTASLFHVAAAASANHFFRQRMNRSFSTTPGTFFQHHLNCFKRPPVNDGFMGVFYNDPLRLGKPNRLFGLITHLFMPPLHHISDIKLIVQHLVYRGATPKVCIGIFRCNMVMDAMLLFISSWAWNFLIIQNPRNLMRTDSTKSHRENPPYHFGSFRIDDKFSFCIRVFAIPIPRKRADEQTLFPLVVKHRADIGRQVFQIPLVDQAIDLTRFFIRSIVCVHMVNDSNEPNAPLNKLSVQVFFHELHIAGKTGLRLGQHHIKFMFACGLYHRIESRTVPIDAGIILIRINLVNIKTFLNGVLDQHRFLVLNTFRFANFIFIFFTQAAINCRFHDLHLSFCAQSSMRNIPHSPLKFKDAKSGAGF